MLLARGFKLSLAIAVVAFSALVICFYAGAGVTLKDNKIPDTYAHYMMGIFYDRQDKLDEAVQEYKQVINLDADNVDARLRLAASYIRKSEFDKATSELIFVKNLDPDNLEAGLLLALLYASQDKSDKALIEYEQVLKKASLKDPKNIEILKGLGAVYYERKNFEAAIKTYSLIPQIDKKDYETFFVLGLLYEEIGKRREAIRNFKEALKINPSHPEALNSLGYIYAEDGNNLNEAEKLIKKALLQDPNNAAYIDSLGWVYFKKNLLREAIEELEKASTLLADPVIFDHLGDAYSKKGSKEKAVSAWKKSLELDQKQDKVKKKIEEAVKPNKNQ